MLKLSAGVESRLRDALATAAQTELRVCERVPKASNIVFRALQDALFILRRLPDPELRWVRGGGRSAWPGFTLSEEEREAAYWQAQWNVVQGLETEESLLARVEVSPREQAAMHDVFEVFRACCVGKDVGRDWRILWLLGCGLSPKEVSRRLTPRIKAPSIEDRRRLQCDAIGAQLRHLMTFPKKTPKVPKEACV